MPHDSTDFVEQFRANHDFIWRSLRSFGVPAASVDDALQEVFMVMHRRLPDFDRRVPVRGWLYGIARKVALAHHRKRPRTVELSQQQVHASALPDEALQHKQAMDAVHRFIEGLDEQKRAVFVMAEIEGMNAPEISEALGVKLNTVYSRLRLARERFTEMSRRLRAQQQGELERQRRRHHG